MSDNKDNKPQIVTRSPPGNDFIQSTLDTAVSVCTTDLKNGFVKVELLIPGLEPGRDKYHPKGGKIQLDFFNSGYSFDMVTHLKDPTNTKIKEYKFSVKRLPGRILIDESKWDVEKGQIVIIMEKHPDSRNIDWGKVAFENGLDQGSSSSSDDD
jgi:hypothetical protein